MSSITPSVGAATFPVFATIDRQQVKMRQSIVGLFLTRSSLPPDKSNAHHLPEVPVCLTFFASMDHVEAVQWVLPGKTGINTSGFSVIKYRKCEYNSQFYIYYYLDSLSYGLTPMS